MTDTATAQTPLPRDSWLIQRLEEPWGGMGAIKDNPFNFGGGLKNGGLSDEAMDLLRPIFSFDYMGAAEFEFGAVPKALSGMVEADDLDAWEFSILYSKIAKPFTFRDGEEEISPPKPRERASLYVIAPAKWRDAIEERIAALASKKPPRLKEGTRMADVLRPTNTPYPTKVRGWLELDNGFLFFADRDMWAATAAVFGIEVDGG